MKRKNLITIEHINIHETVSFKISNLYKEDGTENIELTLVTNPDVIYRSSDYKTILQPPRNIALELDEEAVFSLVTCFVNSVSLILEESEPFFPAKNVINSLNGLQIIVRKNINEKTRYKLIIDVFNEETNKQIVSFSISKTRIILLLMMFKDTFEKSSKKRISTKVTSANTSYVFPIIKADDEIAIKGIWLRNSEKELLRYVVNSLIFDHKFGKFFQNYQAFHRQVLLFENPESKSISVSLKQFDNEKNNLFFTITSQIAAIFFLFLAEKKNYEGDYTDEY